MIFSTHRRKKLEPKRRFGSKEFRGRITKARNYKRVFDPAQRHRLLFIFSKIHWRSKFLRFFLAAVFLVVFYFLVISSHFLVSEIVLTGNSQVTFEQVDQVIKSVQAERWFLIKKNNIFILTRGRVSQLLVSSLPAIKAVSKYKRVWPNKIEIEIKERSSAFVIKSNEKFFLIDDEGTVVRELADSSGFLVAQDQVTEDFALGEPLPNFKLASFVLAASKHWPTKISSPIAEVKFPGKASPDVSIVSSEGWAVLFDLNRPVLTQLNNLAVILNKQISPADRLKLAYLDLRLAKTAYYCFKDSPCVQQPQPEEIPTK